MPQFMQASHLMSCSMDKKVAALFMERFGVDGKLDYDVMVEALYPGVF